MNNNCQHKLTEVWHSVWIYSCLGRGAGFYHLDYEREEGVHTQLRATPLGVALTKLRVCLLNVTDVDWVLLSCGSNWIEWRKLQNKIGYKIRPMSLMSLILINKLLNIGQIHSSFLSGVLNVTAIGGLNKTIL